MFIESGKLDTEKLNSDPFLKNLPGLPDLARVFDASSCTLL